MATGSLTRTGTPVTPPQGSGVFESIVGGPRRIVTVAKQPEGSSGDRVAIEGRTPTTDRTSAWLQERQKFGFGR